MLSGFKKFILRGNVVDMAVGVVIGAAFGVVITALTKDLLTPSSPPCSVSQTFPISDSPFADAISSRRFHQCRAYRFSWSPWRFTFSW